MAEAEHIQWRTHAFQGELSGRLAFSSVSTGKYMAPYFIADFIKQNAHVEIQMDVTNKALVIESLRSNAVDFSFVSILPDSVRCDYIELVQNQLFLVGPAEFQQRKNKYDISIFSELPLIYRERGSGTRHVLERFLQKHRMDVKAKMELTSNEAVKQAVIAGLGFSIMPLIGIKNELQNGQLKIIPVKGFPIFSQWFLIWQKDKRLSPLAAAYLNYVREEKQKIMSTRFGWYEDFALKKSKHFT
ncbi:MAG: LysR substrate-binding domain-containing protein [Flavobacteriales bacterium]